LQNLLKIVYNGYKTITEKNMKTKVFVIPSTHWDREWVLPFEQFRYKLVRLTDRLIDILENNKEYKYFHFDGQTTVIDDYLEIRPENKERIVSLMKEGRLLVGPFRNMLDCLLPSGEAITRNMQIGLNDCKKWGAKSHKLGYTCDTFGHNAQMPQIYANFDIEHCLMLRGREGFEDDKFVWVGADGSETTVYRVHPDYNYADFYLVARWPLQCRNSTNLEEISRKITKRY
jgi:alpha-mannosidase/mannosylglycerate hydrolase